MRTKQKTITIRISIENKKRLEEDRAHFQKTIGGGKWSINDTISERNKILNAIKCQF